MEYVQNINEHPETTMTFSNDIKGRLTIIVRVPKNLPVYFNTIKCDSVYNNDCTKMNGDTELHRVLSNEGKELLLPGEGFILIAQRKITQIEEASNE